MTIAISPFLRNALYLDAAVSGAAGLLMAGGAGIVGPLTGLPEGLLFWAGLVLFPWVALLVAVARRVEAPRLVMIDIVGINVLWAAASFALLATGWVSPNILGVLFVVAQALAVAAFAGLQFAAIRRNQAEA